MIAKNLGYESIADDVSQTVAPFVENPHLRLGDADSGHGVIFGELEGHGMVAVKPHPKLQRAVQESHYLEVATERGLDAIEPVTVASGGLAHYLVTKHRPGLRHMGQMDWKAEANSSTLPTILEPALELAARIIADRHDRRLVNLDSQVRNIVINFENGPVFVDAEKVLVDQRQDVQTLHGNKDVKALGTSVLHRGLLGEKSASYRTSYLTEHVLEPYFEAVDPELFDEPVDLRTIKVQQQWTEFLQRGKTH